MGIVLSALLADIMEADSNYVEFKKLLIKHLMKRAKIQVFAEKFKKSVKI